MLWFGSYVLLIRSVSCSQMPISGLTPSMWPTTSVEMDGWHFILIFFLLEPRYQIPSRQTALWNWKCSVQSCRWLCKFRWLKTGNLGYNWHSLTQIVRENVACCDIQIAGSELSGNHINIRPTVWIWRVVMVRWCGGYCHCKKNWNPLLGTTDSLSICCWRRQSFDSHSASSSECQRDNSPSDRAQASGIEIVRSLLKRHPGAGSQSNWAPL